MSVSLALGTVAAFVVAVLAVVTGGYVLSVYNRLVELRRRVDQAEQNIDVLLKQRRDELTKLIDAVHEAMEYEQGLLTELTNARERAERAATPTEHAEADRQIRTAMASFRARMEDYPELGAQRNLRQFQERISDLETDIARRRETYNDAVTRYNTRIEQFPYVLFARQLGFDDRELFTATEAETADVDVSKAFAR